MTDQEMDKIIRIARSFVKVDDEFWPDYPYALSEHYQALEAALATRVQAGGDAWQPIETAPNDGTDIIVYGRATRWDMDPPKTFPASVNVAWWYDGDECWVCRATNMGSSIEPICWMPLPDIPHQSQQPAGEKDK